MIHVALVRDPIDVTRLIARVASHQVGAIAAFLGTVRNVNGGRPVTGIEYSAYEEMAHRELLAIASEIVQLNNVAVAVEHRLGELSLGDVSVAIVAAHAHRAGALHACQYVIEELKVRVPIWKREHYTDGTRAWVDNRATYVTSEVSG